MAALGSAVIASLLLPLILRQHPTVMAVRQIKRGRTSLSIDGGIEQLIKDIAFDKFISTEFNYDAYLERLAAENEPAVPFRDRTNDTFFKVGIVNKELLANYTDHILEKEIAEERNKPWIPIRKVQAELRNCAMMRYSSYSDHHFQYDRGIYGWMNVMKFACSLVGDQFYLYGFSLMRARFRLKEVYLRKQNRQWATAARAITMRDSAKIVRVFSKYFAEWTHNKFLDELRKLTIMQNQRISSSSNGNSGSGLPASTRVVVDKTQKKDPFIEVSANASRVLRQLFAEPKGVGIPPRGHTFDSLTLPVISRCLLFAKNTSADVVATYAGELRPPSLMLIHNCSNACLLPDQMIETSNVSDSDVHTFAKERLLRAQLESGDVLVAYASARPDFTFETVTKKMTNRVVQVKQHYTASVRQLWEDLLDEQFAHSFRMHHASFLLA